MRRIREVLETHDWTPSPGEDLEELLGTEEDGFGLEVNELEQEMLGLKMAIGDDPEGDEERVDGMESLMLRMQAIKGMYDPIYLYIYWSNGADMSAELPENERKRFAAKAVGDIMKEI